MINEDGVEIEHGMVVYEPWKGGYYLKKDADAKIAELEKQLAEEKEFGLNRAKSADHEIGKMSEEIVNLHKENEQLKESQQAWIAKAEVAEETIAKLEKKLSELREKYKQIMDDGCKLCHARLNKKDTTIERLGTELSELRKENEDLKNELFSVKTDMAMATRWRKYPEEKPQDGQVVWAYEANSKQVLTLEYEKTDEGEGFICFPYTHDFYTSVTQWMPYNKPKEPEVK